MNALIPMLMVLAAPRLWGQGVFVQANALTDAGLANVLLAAGIVLVMFYLISRIRKRGKQPPPTRLSVQETLEKQKQTRALGGDLEQVMVEIEQMSRRVGSQMDAKAARLESLIAEADRRITQLQTHATSASVPTIPASDKIEPNRRTGDRLPVDQVSADELPNTDPLSKQVYDLADQGMNAEAIAHKLQEHIGKVELILALRRT